MGSTQSKQQAKKWSAERLQQDSIVAAIAANKRQRKLLLKQAKHHRSQQLAAPRQAAPPGSPTTRQRQQQAFFYSCQPDDRMVAYEPSYEGDSYDDYDNQAAYGAHENHYDYELDEDYHEQQREQQQQQQRQHYKANGKENAPTRGSNHAPFSSNFNNALLAATTTATTKRLGLGLGKNGLTTTQGNKLHTLSCVSATSLAALAEPGAQVAPAPPTLASRQASRETLLIGASTKPARYSREKQPSEMRQRQRQFQLHLQQNRQLQIPICESQQHSQGLARRHRRRRRPNYLQQPALLEQQQLLPLQQQQQQQQYQQASRLRHHQRHKNAQLPLPQTLKFGQSQSSMSLYSSHSSSCASATNNHLLDQHLHIQTTTSSTASQQNQHQYQSEVSTMEAHGKQQRGLSYTEEERQKLNLLGLLPAAQRSQELETKAVINFIDKCQDELSKYIYLRNLKDFNERLFYATLTQNVEKLMPLVYTPTVGLACQKFSEIYMRPRGLFVTINDLNRVSSLLANWREKDVRVIVVTDGERILGLGDLGANGMGISIGKLSLYTALAGIPPQNVLPVTIDVGTNNQQNLEDPFYIGLRQQRVRGEKYDALVEEFMRSVVERWGRSCLIQFEDFANSTAFNLLVRYRNKYCTFNDDIQGTASVCLSGLISAAKLINRRLADSTYLFYGAGEANLGTANLLIMAMLEEGDISEKEAKSRIWLVDSKGLVVSSRTDLSAHKSTFAQVDAPNMSNLENIIEYAKPLAIIGASAQGGAFTESICKKMASINERPIIFALSNPTSKAECTAEQAYKWTQGRCVFASGSPFEPVVYNDKTYITGQGNNAYIFPAVGLAAIAAHVHTIPEDTFLVAAKALSDQLTASDTSVGLVYPRLSKIRDVTLKVATRVLEHFYSERLATYRPEPNDKLNFLRSIQYDCRYEPLELNSISTLGQMSLANNNRI